MTGWLAFWVLLLVTTLLALFLGLHLRSTLLQRRSVAAVQNIGGQIRYDYEYPNGRYGVDDLDYQAKSSVPPWLLNSLKQMFLGQQQHGGVADAAAVAASGPSAPAVVAPVVGSARKAPASSSARSRLSTIWREGTSMI